MGRPKAVVYKNLNQYTKLQSLKTKMYSGVEITELHLVKETSQFLVGIECWSHLASKFKRKKPFELSINIPIIENQKSIDFLEKNYWKDYDGGQDDKEAIDFLNKIFPEKEKKHFYELDQLVSKYVRGSFISYDKDGNVEDLHEHDLKQQIHTNASFNKFLMDEEVVAKMNKWTNEKNETLGKQYLREYLDFEREYAFKHYNLIDTFIDVCKNSVCFVVMFSDSTADWYKEKYGKTCAYAHAGEIIFVATKDSVYFEVVRHF